MQTTDVVCRRRIMDVVHGMEYFYDECLRLSALRGKGISDTELLDEILEQLKLSKNTVGLK
jgi:NifB/MoaA-like Fe-S oxidoreductase